MVELKGSIIHLVNIVSSILFIIIGAYSCADYGDKRKVSDLVGGVYLMMAGIANMLPDVIQLQGMVTYLGFLYSNYYRALMYLLFGIYYIVDMRIGKDVIFFDLFQWFGAYFLISAVILLLFSLSGQKKTPRAFIV